MQTLEPKLQNSLPNLEKILLLGIKIGIFLTLLTPLVLSRFGVFPIIGSKAIYFYILIEIILFFYLLLLLLDRKYLPKISPIFISVLIFIEILILSTWRSINPLRSFWGSMERMEGLILLLHFFVFFLILVAVFRQKKDWLDLLRCTVLVSIPVGLTALIKILGIFHFYTDPSDPRISATLGNPVFYGNYLTLIIFLAFFLLIFEKRKGLKILFAGTVIYNLFLLLLTGTRGAWTGTIFAGFFLILVWFLFLSKDQEEKRKAFLFGIFIFLLFFLLFYLFSETGYLPKTNFLVRFESIFSTLVEFKNARFYVWGLGINAWKDSPFLGYGLESFAFIYDRYYQASFLEVIPESLFFDRAHNKVVDILVANGIVGLLSYLGIFATAFFVILKNHTGRFSLFLSFILIALFLGHFVQNIFSFDTINTYLIFFLVLGFIDVNFRKIKNNQGLKQEQKQQEKRDQSNIPVGTKISWIKIGTAFLIFLLTVITIFTVNLRPFQTKLQLTEAHRLLAAGEVKDSFELLQGALSGPRFTRFEAHYYAAEIVFFAQPLSQYKGLEKEFSRELQKITRFIEDYLDENKDILQMRSYLLLAKIYKTLYSIESDPKYLEDEERILGKALELNPQFSRVYRLAGEMRFLQRRKEEGITLFAKAYELDKNWANFYDWLGVSLMQINEKEEGAEALRKSLRLGDFYTKGKFNFEIVWKLANVYEELGDYQEMAAFYEEVISRCPFEKPDPQLYASLSTVYAKMGEKEKARQTTMEMLKFYPELLPQAQQFLSTLEENEEL